MSRGSDEKSNRRAQGAGLIKYSKKFQNAQSPVNCSCIYRDIVKCPGFGGSESHYFVGKHSLALAQKCTDAQTPVCIVQHNLAGIGF